MVINNSLENFATATGESNRAIIICICIIFAQFLDWYDACLVQR